MGRNLTVSEEVVRLVFTLRSGNGWSHSQIGGHFGKSKAWAAKVFVPDTTVGFVIMCEVVQWVLIVG